MRVDGLSVVVSAVSLSLCRKTEPMQEDAKRKRLVAAAAAYVAVHLRGRIQVDLKKDSVTLGGKTRVWDLAGGSSGVRDIGSCAVGFCCRPEDFEDDPTWGCRRQFRGCLLCHSAASAVDVLWLPLAHFAPWPKLSLITLFHCLQKHHLVIRCGTAGNAVDCHLVT